MPFLVTSLLEWGWLEATGRLRVGAVWMGWWESSKPSLPDRRAFITKAGRVGESKILFEGGGRAQVGWRKLRRRYSIS